MADISFTVITPVYNQGATLARTIQSVKNQGYKNLQHIIAVCSLSTDETIAVAKSFSDHVTIIYDDGKGGPELAINNALEISTGDFINILGASETLLPEALKSVTQHLTKNRQCLFLSGVSKIESECGTLFMRGINLPYTYERLLYGGQILCAEATFFSRELLIKKNARLIQSLASDYHLWLSLLKGLSPNQYIFLDQELVTFCVHKGQRSKDLQHYSQAMVKVRDSFINTEICTSEINTKIINHTREVESDIIDYCTKHEQFWSSIHDHHIWFSGNTFNGFQLQNDDTPNFLKKCLLELKLHSHNTSIKKIVIYGVGKHTEKLYALIQSLENFPQITGFLDDDPIHSQETLYNLPIYLSQDYKNLEFDLVLLSSDVYEEKMMQRCQSLNLPTQRIYGEKIKWLMGNEIHKVSK